MKWKKPLGSPSSKCRINTPSSFSVLRISRTKFSLRGVDCNNPFREIWLSLTFLPLGVGVDFLLRMSVGFDLGAVM